MVMAKTMVQNSQVSIVLMQDIPQKQQATENKIINSLVHRLTQHRQYGIIAVFNLETAKLQLTQVRCIIAC